MPAADGDVIVLNLHHAAGDGLSALRLLGSITRAYAQDDDQFPPVGPLEARDVAALAAPGSVKERLECGRAGLDYLARGVATPTRIAPVGARNRLTASHSPRSSPRGGAARRAAP